ncbi:MAG: class I SAM-dependent methyltransferase [Oscillospiraceae bacterium]|nr:class I SAM-dependent methyltransferase [Oscillospiraceae bacterium]
MDRHDEIKAAYRSLGSGASFYDGMITCTTIVGRVVCKIVWDLGRHESRDYLSRALSAIPKEFTGRLLEAPVGTGVLTAPLYKTLPHAEITCLDYSEEMMLRAQQRAKNNCLSNVSFVQGDIGKLPFADNTFDIVLSLNGFHAFPDKEAAYNEVFRVLKFGGCLCGCFYIAGETPRTDWFIRHIYERLGYFTPPYETAESLKKRLEQQYEAVEVSSVKSIACFACRKGLK